MSHFMQFYRWGLVMKQSMALYTLALVFFKALANLLLGISSVDSLTMLEMLAASMLWAMLESALFPYGKVMEGDALRSRTILWAVSGNVLLVGGALVFGWFDGVPLWAGILLVVFLQAGMFAIWVGLHVALKKDSNALNRNLQQYQNGK